MDIKEIARQIYKDEPKHPRSIQLQLDTISNDVGQVWEVVSLFLLEGIEQKIMKHPKLQNEDLNIKKFIQEQTYLLKQYCNSINVDFTLSMITKNEVKSIDFIDRPLFFTKDKYSFYMTFLYKCFRKNKEYLFKYNPGRSKLNTIKDGVMLIQIENHYFKIKLNFL